MNELNQLEKSDTASIDPQESDDINFDEWLFEMENSGEVPSAIPEHRLDPVPRSLHDSAQSETALEVPQSVAEAARAPAPSFSQHKQVLKGLSDMHDWINMAIDEMKLSGEEARKIWLEYQKVRCESTNESAIQRLKSYKHMCLVPNSATKLDPREYESWLTYADRVVGGRKSDRHTIFDDAKERYMKMVEKELWICNFMLTDGGLSGSSKKVDQASSATI